MDAPDLPAAPEWCSVAEAAHLIRRHRTDAPGQEILAEIEQAAATGEIRARGRRRLYRSDRTLRIAHDDPHFVWFADWRRCPVGEAGGDPGRRMVRSDVLFAPHLYRRAVCRGPCASDQCGRWGRRAAQQIANGSPGRKSNCAAAT